MKKKKRLLPIVMASLMAMSINVGPLKAADAPLITNPSFEHEIDKNEGLTFDNYYTCGPEPMLDALALNYPENGQLSFEARMGCGFGACMGCSCKVKTRPYKRICVEGPILESNEVIVNG